MWEDVHEAVDEILIKDAIGTILNSLKPRYRSVLFCRFWYGMTLEETGKKFNVTREVIRQNEAKALRILRSEKYAKEFDKLGLDWIENIRLEREREKKREQEEQEQWNREWHKKCIEKEIAERKERKAREKLKIVDSDIPKPEAIVKPYSPKAPWYPPHFVKLLYNEQNEPFLHVDQVYGSIDRRLDPATYDRWLNHLLQSQRNNAHAERLETYKKMQDLQRSMINAQAIRSNLCGDFTNLV